MNREDGSYWLYFYNDRGELISGKKYWADNSPVWGAQTENSYDTLGNRTSAKSGGNQLNQLRQSTFTTNSLNQYSQRSVPGAVDITGTANSAATVTVNDLSTARKGDYFYKELAVDNTAGPVNAQITVTGARQNFGAGGEDAVTQQGGHTFLPQAAESFTFDFDGNLTSDGHLNYSWDAENRLLSMEAIPRVPVDVRQRLEFVYDAMARRVQKKVYAWNISTSTYQLQSTTRFVYDGWNLVAEVDGNNNLVRNYVRGAGELLLVNGGGDTHQVGYDGNQNVGVLVKGSDSSVSASYDYDPFGQTMKAVGGFAMQNPFRFSDQYADVESGLIYYGFRYYNPQIGRWISRDPMAEAGGSNLYNFVSNHPITDFDLLGLKSLSEHGYDKLIELFTHHDNEVGRLFPGDKRGRSDTDCIIYVRNVLEYAYEKIGRKDISDRIHAMPKDGGVALASYLVSLGWRAHYWNPDVRHPRDGDSEHPDSYKKAVAKRMYYGITVSGFIVNYNLQDKSVHNEWILIPSPDLGTIGGVPFPMPTRIQVGGDNLGAFTRFKSVRLAYGIARGGMHTFLYSFGDIYEVHWTKEKDELYGKSPFNTFVWNSGMMFTPPDSDFSSEERKTP